jgi:hypothetical protein
MTPHRNLIPVSPFESESDIRPARLIGLRGRGFPFALSEGTMTAVLLLIRLGRPENDQAGKLRVAPTHPSPARRGRYKNTWQAETSTDVV